MSVGESTNGIRGKVKATRDFYKRRENKSSCPILSCDGCDEPEEEARTERTVAPRAAGSVAARAQAWEKSTSTAGYVTIGSVRYGVRFSSSSEEPVPSRDSAANERDHVENDYCCDVMQMAWPRPRGTSLSPSKIPLPNAAEKTQAINKRKASEEKATPVYRSTLEVSRPKKSSVGCFAVDTDESNSGEMKATPPTPNPARRPLFPKPNFKFGNSSGEVADTSRLIPPDSKEDLGTGNQFQITLDKLHKFRFGGGNDKANGNKKKRGSDKTERLRELTDKLLHSRGTGTGNPDRKKPPACNSTSPPKVSNKPGLRNLFGSTSSLTGSQNKKREGSVQSVESEPRVPEVKSEYANSDVSQVESKPAGSHAQRMNAFRSASFSQVDYDTTDGKYTRTNQPKPVVPTIGCVTFPRVKQVDASTSVSPPPDKVTEETGSTPSVDSAVGSDEGFVIGSSNNLAIDSHKPSGSRSLTYPFTKKTSKSDEMPFSSIDGNGLKSLQHSPSLNRELSDVKEEVSLSSETPTIVDTLSECSNDTVQEQKTSDSPNPAMSSNAETKTVYQCTVKEYPVQVPSQENSLESLEKEINDLITQQKGNTSPKPEIFVTTWPKEPGKPKTKLTLKCENDYKATNWKDEEDKSEGEDNKKDSKRWSVDTYNDCSSEPISPEDASFRNQWIKNSEKPKLTCQSSDEKEEECCRRHQLNRNDSLSEGESDQGDRRPSTPMRDRERTCSPSPYTPTYDLSDSEGRNGSIHGPRRYSKRPLRGPYGQMLEAEMKKPETRLSKKQLNEDLKFLEEYMSPLPENRASPSEASRPSSESRLTCPRPRINAGRSFDDSQLQNVYNTNPRSSPKRKASTVLPFPVPKEGVVPCHQRTTSSPSQLEGISGSGSANGKNTKATQELLAELLKGSSERRFVTEDNPLSNAQNSKDTRTHVVVELFDTERSYVESLQIIVKKYLRPLKSPENVNLVDASVVDEIFFQVPAILSHHEILLEELRKRLEHWDARQKVGDIFMEVFTKSTVIETYTSFINNWKTAKEAIRTTCQQKPAFARFLEAMTREHKGKLALDSLIIMPVQRIPRYELLIQRLLKHTDTSHPDHALLLAAQHKVHELAVKINLTERETLELEQQQQTLRDLEALIEGPVDLTSSERSFVRHDIVTMASGQGTRKERALFLFSDLLIITSIKRRSGTIRKPATTCPGSVTGSMDANKYKLLMRIPIDDLEVVKTKDENFKKMIKEIEKLTEDAATLNQISELTLSLHCPRGSLEEIVKDMLANVNKQLSERQNTDSQLSYLELMLNTQHGIENISVVFTKAEKRASWEESFSECKQKLALSADRRPTPEFVAPVPIRKTRAGLQFTCAAPTLGLNAFELKDVWVCNSDGYVGQVCVLSLQPEPTVTSCNGVCNARILCIASIPAGGTSESRQRCNKAEPDARISIEDTNGVSGNIELVSSSSSEDDDEGDAQDYASRRSKSEPIANEPAAEETDNQQPTMWLGTEDGNIHVYLCSDNVRIKKNKVKIQHGSSVQSIIYLDQKVFVSLANGDVTAYVRDQVGGWNTSDPYTVSIGTTTFPVTKMIPVDGKLWCGCHNTIRVLNTSSLQIEHSFQVSPDASKVVTGMAVSGFGVWISLQNSAVVRLFHSSSYENLCDVNVAPAVTKMLAGCDDIIRQHKAACLRVTALLACKELLWIGTSAGVVLTMTLPHVTQSTTKLLTVPNVTGVPHGHTGHVRFLTSVEATSPAPSDPLLRQNPTHRHSKTKIDLQPPSTKLLVISGGDGYEDFRNSNTSEVAGREDSTNHLLLWHI